jgi:dienelactone hydrolase
MEEIMKHTLFTLLLLGVSYVAMAGEEISYTVDGTTFKGYIARPSGSGAERGGVLVVHEWWGHDDYVRRRADMLAELGYVALAVDMYGDGKVADHPEDAGKFAGEVRKNLDYGEQRFRAAFDLLSSQSDVAAGRIGAIGYCFGGGLVLEMARRGLPLAGVASFHGSLGGLSPVKSGAVKGRVLVLNGADDPFIKAEQIAAFKKDMDAAGANYRFINYPGAVHSFTNPDATENGKKFNLPLAYNAEVDAKSWAAMKELFEDVLR